MSARISLITLGVDDLPAATAFYEKIGFRNYEKHSQESVTFLDAGGLILGLFGREALAEDANSDIGVQGRGAVALAQNLESEQAVDAYLELVKTAGATILKPAQKVFWGGYSGYFADPEGHIWEVAFNPFWKLDENGGVVLDEA